MNYKCQKGCMQPTRSGGEVQKWHSKRSECPYEPTYKGPTSTASPAGTPTDSKPAPTGTPPVAGAPPAAKPQGRGLLTFRPREASTTTRTSPTTEQVKPDFEVDSDHALSLFELFDNIITRLVRFGDTVLGAEHKFEGKVLLASTADEELVKKKMGRSLATRFTRALGATTQEEAHAIIDSGGLIVLIAGGLFSVGSHILEEWPKALKKKAEERKQKKLAKADFKDKAPAGTAVPGGVATGAA
jgi:hypothetical protein